MPWHQRLGHIENNGLQVLHDNGMVEGMSNFSLDFDLCEHCLYEKLNQGRLFFCSTRSERVLQLLHNDVFGTVLVPS